MENLRDELYDIILTHCFVTDAWDGGMLADWEHGYEVMIAGIDEAVDAILSRLTPHQPDAPITPAGEGQEQTPLSPDACADIGCNIIHWNPKYNGGFFEYYLPVKGDGRGPYDVRLSVRFGEHPDHPFRVYLIGPSSMFVLDYIVTIEDFVTMYRFVTGKRPNTRLETDAADGAAHPC